MMTDVDELKILSSMAMRGVVRELAARYEQATSRIIKAEAAGGVDVAKRVRSDDRVDVVILASDAIDQLLAEGKLQGGRVDLTKSGVSIAVRAGAPKPEIGSEEEVRHAVATATSLSYSTGPSGVYLEGLFKRWGILDAIRGRILVPPPGVAVGSLVAAGKAELGFQQLSELMALPGIEVVGPLPAAIQIMTTFSGALAASGSRREAAQALLEFMASPNTSEVKRKHGMQSA